MRGPLQIRSAGGYAVPGYPGLPVEPAALSRRRYGESVLERMRRGLARPLVVFGLFASLQLPASGDDEKPRDPARQHAPGDPEPGDGSAVRMLSRDEIAGLIAGLDQLQVETGVMVRGEVAGQMGFISEEEGRALLDALFEKNGFSIARDVRVLGSGLDFTADGFDAERKVGFEFGGPENPGAWEFHPAESDLGPDEIAELDLARARRERAILVVDGASYAYNVEYMNHLPSKAQAVDRLLDDVRRFLVWLAEERR